MQGTVEQSLMGIGASKDRQAVRRVLRALADRFSTVACSSAGLVISAGGSALARIGAAAFQAVVNGRPVTIAATTNMPALTGLTITANAFNVACFFVDQAGTTSVAFGREGATKGAVQFPEFPEKKALIGYLIITHSSTFTGGTTPLDTATTEFVSPIGAVDPSVLLN